MKFFNLRLVLFLLFIATTSFSQNQNVTKKDSLWERKNTVGLDISQIAFVNWNAGGVSSISGLLKGDFSRKYKRKNLKWVNELIVRYGVNKQDGIELRKTDDAIKFNSTIGHRKDSLSLWYSTAKFEFSTQFTNGYSYPNTTNAISKPFAPAYIFLGVGSEYNDKKNNLTVYVSPLTMKSTLVLDQRLANQGAFGVTKATYDVDGNLLTEGELYRFELGFLVTSQFKKELYKNVIFENRLSLYSDYINKFGNVDVDWQFKFDLVVNEYIKANIGTHIIYDDDIKAKEEVNGEQVTIGPKIQLKQMLGVGLVYNF
ncbi:MAG TPA: DUF3078 domain-containing protein [Flavobacterium sp.]|uniref:DUF3078 domain-containing protein n=1 Tax=Flavobacterium sp. TaxID=239 RepID=UPI002B768213|nr:DUF3078 domain-containing protein [Flavobacterium sp.]HPW97683.1 DUF3078 domain-containing protein [Flavobacterium sp.]HQA73416.1 DUF3078 domain-containing protein [Flavobacterium sp.]